MSDTVNKDELIESMAMAAGLSKKDAEAALVAFTDQITKSLTEGKRVTLTGFGTFSVSERAPREGVNPQNPSQKIQIPAVKVPKFKAGKTLKDAVKM